VRFLFLIPDLDRAKKSALRLKLEDSPLRRLFRSKRMSTDQVWGGTLNIMRHCTVARAQGADAVLATESGTDSYGDIWGIEKLPFVRWADRRPDDVCILPDIYTHLIDGIDGWAVAYEQSPIFVRHDFDHKRERVLIWTDSPHMLAICQREYPGKNIPIVPNIVDDSIFPFIPQSERRTGELMAFPRKGPEFIEETMKAYQAAGGSYWKLTMVDGLPLADLAKRFRTPQVFLASAPVEGCALPPQEAMSAGMVVVGRNANSSNFYMRDGETALVADTPDKAAQALRALEDGALRERLSHAGHDYIQRFFKQEEPARFWRATIDSPRWKQS
jgi:hypothetical protein